MSAKLDNGDNGPVVLGVTWFLFALSGGFLGLRLYAKLSRHQRLWWDDYILVLSWVRRLHCVIKTEATRRWSRY